MIFVDTTFWVGDADSNDDFHESSHMTIEAIRTGKAPSALTTDFVLDETVTILGKRKGFGAGNAAKVADSLLSSPRVFTVYIDEALLRESLRLYTGHKEDLSLTDASSRVVMRRYGVGRLFSHDHDFDDLGIKRSESL